jgi:hypothetical protein
MKRQFVRESLNEYYDNSGRYAVVFDGTSAYIEDANDVNEDDFELVEYYLDIDRAQERADEINKEAND